MVEVGWPLCSLKHEIIYDLVPRSFVGLPFRPRFHPSRIVEHVFLDDFWQLLQGVDVAVHRRNNLVEASTESAELLQLLLLSPTGQVCIIDAALDGLVDFPEVGFFAGM